MITLIMTLIMAILMVIMMMSLTMVSYLVNVISLIPTTSTSIQFMSFSTSRGNSSLALKQKIAILSKYKILQSVSFFCPPFIPLCSEAWDWVETPFMVPITGCMRWCQTHLKMKSHLCSSRAALGKASLLFSPRQTFFKPDLLTGVVNVCNTF